MKKAIIVGSNGQDGKLLFKLLLETNYKIIIGIDKNFVKCSGIAWDTPIDISNKNQVYKLIETIKPDEIYYLAAFHHSSEDTPLKDSEMFTQSYNTHVFYFMNFLEATKKYSPKTRIFYAASSHIFGDTPAKIQDENTPLNPVSVYGITKADGLLIGRYYRNKYGIFVSTGILYNHESSYRDKKFVSKKIITTAINIKAGKQSKLVIGNLTAEADWGYAPDYVDAMQKILNIETPGEYIIATGIKHTILDFIKITFEYLGLDWRIYIEEDKGIVKRKYKSLVGNPTKLMNLTGWHSTVDFKHMIRLLLIAEGIQIND